jgi:hypothetical protein
MPAFERVSTRSSARRSSPPRRASARRS